MIDGRWFSDGFLLSLFRLMIVFRSKGYPDGHGHWTLLYTASNESAGVYEKKGGVQDSFTVYFSISISNDYE